MRYVFSVPVFQRRRGISVHRCRNPLQVASDFPGGGRRKAARDDVSQNRAHSPPRALAPARPAPGGHRRMDRMVESQAAFIAPSATYPRPPMRSSTIASATPSRSRESKPPSLQKPRAVQGHAEAAALPPAKPQTGRFVSDRARRSSTPSGRPQTPSPPSSSRHCPAMPQKQVPKDRYRTPWFPGWQIRAGARVWL